MTAYHIQNQIRECEAILDKHYEDNPDCILTGPKLAREIGHPYVTISRIKKYWGKVGMESGEQRRIKKAKKLFQEFFGDRDECEETAEELSRILGCCSPHLIRVMCKEFGKTCRDPYPKKSLPPSSEYESYPSAWRNPLLESWGVVK
jgi:hypothetical protein